MEEWMSNELHIILGTGPVGCWIAIALRELHIPVRAVNRSGKRPDLMPADVEIIASDVSDVASATAAATGAHVIYQALNPPYHEWHTYFPGLQAAALAAARSTGARYVSIENLYMYDSSKPMDVGRAAAMLGTRQDSLGSAWIAPHAPALSQGAMVEKACRALKIKPQMTVVSPLMMRIAGFFIPEARASVEMMYEFTDPFVVDSNGIQRAFGLEPTPVDIAIERTTSWYKKHAGTQ